MIEGKSIPCTIGGTCTFLHFRANRGARMTIVLFVVLHAAKLWNEGTKNPSVLEHAKPDHPNCTHDLYRLPKTGSTSLYNAVMRDPSLHRHICWLRTHKRDGHKWHIPPPKKDTRPIILALREPVELLRSHLEYKDYITNASTPVEARTIKTMSWVASRNKSSADIYLCNGGGNPDIHVQLRVYFHDTSIKNIADENHNPRVRTILTNGRPLLHFAHPSDLAVWRRECAVR